jgi:hypothetical protein
MSQNNNKKVKNQNVTLLIFLIVFFVFSGSNVDQGAQGHRPLALGWPTVSKLPKISEIWFGLESTKKKKRFFEKRPNVCKWLKNCFKYYSGRDNGDIGCGIGCGVGVGNGGGNGNGNGNGNGGGGVCRDKAQGEADMDDEFGEIKPFREKTKLVLQRMLVSQWMLLLPLLSGMFKLISSWSSSLSYKFLISNLNTMNLVFVDQCSYGLLLLLISFKYLKKIVFTYSLFKLSDISGLSCLFNSSFLSTSSCSL